MTSIENPALENIGGLDIALNSLDIALNSTDGVVTATYDSSSWGVQTSPNGMADDIRGKFTQNNILDLERELRKKLSGQNRWVFPGNGTFTMANPMFNQNGDLVVGISYEMWNNL
jgi:hypothetical protein